MRQERAFQLSHARASGPDFGRQLPDRGQDVEASNHRLYAKMRLRQRLQDRSVISAILLEFSGSPRHCPVHKIEPWETIRIVVVSSEEAYLAVLSFI